MKRIGLVLAGGLRCGRSVLTSPHLKSSGPGQLITSVTKKEAETHSMFPYTLKSAS